MKEYPDNLKRKDTCRLHRKAPKKQTKKYTLDGKVALLVFGVILEEELSFFPLNMSYTP
jgi:hypothetical protein